MGYIILIQFIHIPNQQILSGMQRHGDPVAPVNSPRVPMDPLPPQMAIVSEGMESVLTSPSPPSVPHRKQKRGLQPTQNPSSSRASVVFPILGAANPFARKTQEETMGYGTLREDHFNNQQANVGSDPSVCTHSSPELPSSPVKGGEHSILPKNNKFKY